MVYVQYCEPASVAQQQKSMSGQYHDTGWIYRGNASMYRHTEVMTQLPAFRRWPNKKLRLLLY